MSNRYSLSLYFSGFRSYIWWIYLFIFSVHTFFDSTLFLEILSFYLTPPPVQYFCSLCFIPHFVSRNFLWVFATAVFLNISFRSIPYVTFVHRFYSLYLLYLFVRLLHCIPHNVSKIFFYIRFITHFLVLLSFRGRLFLYSAHCFIPRVVYQRFFFFYLLQLS